MRTMNVGDNVLRLLLFSFSPLRDRDHNGPGMRMHLLLISFRPLSVNAISKTF